MPTVAQRVRFFGPEESGEVERFMMFYASTYAFSPRDKRAVSGVSHHFQKAYRLYQLAQKLAPNLDLDEAELETHGVTPAHNAIELAMVLEAGFLELYSTLDCTVKTLFAVYHPDAKSKLKSTRGFFAGGDRVWAKMPPEIVTLMEQTGWYKRLLHLRDELTHLAAGAVHRDRESRLIRYVHHGLTEEGRVFELEDVFVWTEQMLRTVNEWTGQIFHVLNASLSDTEIDVMCMMIDGRLMMRRVSGKPPVTFHSGRCLAASWFDLPANPRCPLADGCGAYERRVGGPAPLVGDPPNPEDADPGKQADSQGEPPDLAAPKAGAPGGAEEGDDHERI